MGLGLDLLSGTVKLAADWRKKGVNAQTASRALLELAGCAAIAAGVTQSSFLETAATAYDLAKELEK